MLKKIPIDAYTLLLIGMVALATVLPVSGQAAVIVSFISYCAVALLFFLYGARLKTQVVIEGMTNWRLQALIFGATYLMFPVLGCIVAFLCRGWLPDELVTGFLFLAILPSTVQSSIALTAMAGGNVAAAICAASLSNMLGVVLTPLLAMFVLSADGFELNAGSALWICVQILLPFIAGQLVRPFIGSWIERNKLLTTTVDRGSILLIVYSAFSAGVVAGIWKQFDATTLILLVAINLVLLFVVMYLIRQTGRLAGLPRADEVSFLFCGAQKSLASGVPIANILFAGHATSFVILPLMFYHQFQLVVSAAIAQRMAASQRAKTGG